MNFKALVCVLLIALPLIEGKRSFGITGRRNKSKSPSVRRGQHGHDGDDHIPVPKPPPSPADTKRNVGWNTQHQPQGGHQAPSAPPLGPQAGPGLYGANQRGPPPPPYGAHGSYGAAPPAYGSNTANYGVPPPSYGHAMGGGGGYGQHQPAYGGYGAMGGGGMPMMGAATPVMMMPVGGNYNRGGGFGGGGGSGIMTNLFAGLAGYQLAKAFSGGGSHHRDREVIVIDNRQVEATATQQLPAPAGPITNPSTAHSEAVPQSHDSLPQQSHFHQSSSTEIPHLEPQITPASNEYNYWGLPQYGVPLYGFNLPSQITDYYKVETYKPDLVQSSL